MCGKGLAASAFRPSEAQCVPRWVDVVVGWSILLQGRPSFNPVQGVARASPNGLNPLFCSALVSAHLILLGAHGARIVFGAEDRQLTLASSARLGAPLRIVHLSFSDSTRLVKAVLPALVYSCIRASSIACASPSVPHVARATLCKTMCGLARPQVCPHVLLQTLANRRDRVLHTPGASGDRTVESMQKLSVGRFSRYLTRGNAVFFHVLSFHSFVPVTWCSRYVSRAMHNAHHPSSQLILDHRLSSPGPRAPLPLFPAIARLSLRHTYGQILPGALCGIVERARTSSLALQRAASHLWEILTPRHLLYCTPPLSGLDHPHLALRLESLPPFPVACSARGIWVPLCMDDVRRTNARSKARPRYSARPSPPPAWFPSPATRAGAAADVIAPPHDAPAPTAPKDPGVGGRVRIGRGVALQYEYEAAGRFYQRERREGGSAPTLLFNPVGPSRSTGGGMRSGGARPGPPVRPVVVSRRRGRPGRQVCGGEGSGAHHTTSEWTSCGCDDVGYGTARVGRTGDWWKLLMCVLGGHGKGQGMGRANADVSVHLHRACMHGPGPCAFGLALPTSPRLRSSKRR
ncbi:hypothetical protein B0H13DRAFT_2326902 [Mycena leptocephala]|nr:hypothetical protein B0H13DRAFT_2326902 [Mycena leptocephala]